MKKGIKLLKKICVFMSLVMVLTMIPQLPLLAADVQEESVETDDADVQAELTEADENDVQEELTDTDNSDVQAEATETGEDSE